MFLRKIRFCLHDVRPSGIRFIPTSLYIPILFLRDTIDKNNKISTNNQKFLNLDFPLVSWKWKVIFSNISSSCRLNELEFGMCAP